MKMPDISSFRHRLIGLIFALLLLTIFGTVRLLQDPAEPAHGSENRPAVPAHTADPGPPPSSERSLELNLPLVGEITGARWITNQVFRNLDPGYEAVQSPPLDVLVDVEGNFLVARYGSDRFQTMATEAIHREALGLYLVPDHEYSVAPKEVLKKVDKVRLIRAPLDDPELRKDIFCICGNSRIFKFATWYKAEVYHDGLAQPKVLTIHTWTQGVINEFAAPLNLSSEFHDPTVAERNPSLVGGANRYAATVGINIASPGATGYMQRFVTETWAGFTPWRDDQLDPEYGELLPNELIVPVDRTINLSTMQHFSRKSPPIPPEVKARIDREAAEKAASKNK